MTVAEIAELVAMYGRCADHLRQAGYDGVEIHAAHGVLMEHFLSPYFNQRTDRYGGDREGRMRLLIESLQAVRDGGSSGMAVGIRLISDERLPGGLTPDDVQDILVDLVGRGLLDFADMDIAVEPQQAHLMTTPSLVAPLHIRDLVASIRKAVSPQLAVISSLGRVTSIAEAERMLAEGAADMIGAARGLIAEPELVRNAREGREARSRTCLACNYCIAAVQHSGAFGCAINPASGRERRWGVRSFSTAVERGKVVVIGAGPAGLEAARVAALRGHDVVVLERRRQIGGQLALWGTLPGRETYRSAVDWYERELVELGVEVCTDVLADPTRVLAENPTAVIVASGARYAATGESGFLPIDLSGHDRGIVYTPERVLDGTVSLGGTVVILDDEGIHTGVGVAEAAARQGAKVHLVTRHQQLMANLTYDGHLSLILPRLMRLGVQLHTRSYLREIGADKVILFDVFTDETRVISGVNAVVLATMRKPEDVLARDLAGQVPQLFAVGDALAARGLAEATYEGHQFARLIGDGDAPRTTGEYLLRPIPAAAFARPAAALRGTS
jgi:thioredoxin reductase